MLKKRGGKRPNAGRKKVLPASATPVSIRMTKNERELVRELLKKVRGQ